MVYFKRESKGYVRPCSIITGLWYSCSSLCYAAITIGLSISLQPSFSDTVVFIVYHIREKMYALFSFYKQV
ncbi:hypothetical protein CLOBOL_06180 [Enterocloster bolteae ATCC BAA-613]|uniref:Uncharacterized protein n=1 Tax=Enterocloster bolteae (strain ATCC BAA-613 / DSM 15670 / CCUG 46953 / JCM 12243 / WAL 16351) TaxID=411902 RepID=A8S1V4_ENTBW|nr:hypothetical protein CLOBOL_06180 [Enterocloster bolteae ATCC BAA-613]